VKVIDLFQKQLKIPLILAFIQSKEIILNNRLKYLFYPHFRSICCGWSSFCQNV